MSKLEEGLKAWQAKYEKKAHRSVQRPAYAHCPPALRMSADQYRCPDCGQVWDVGEQPDPCDYTAANSQD